MFLTRAACCSMRRRGRPCMNPEPYTTPSGRAQVALMFLTRGVLHHEAAWALWFAHARGLLPAALLRARGCEPRLLASLASACGAAASPRLLQQQHLFSVYVHVGANDAKFQGAFCQTEVFLDL